MLHGFLLRIFYLNPARRYYWHLSDTTKSQPLASMSWTGVTYIDSYQRQWWIKEWGIMPTTAWHWGGDGSVINNTLGAPAPLPLYLCLPSIMVSVDAHGVYTRNRILGLICILFSNFIFVHSITSCDAIFCHQRGF